LPQSERRNRAAPIISLLLHALIIYLAIRLTAAVVLPAKSPIGDAIEMVLGGGGGGGGHGGATFDKAHPPPPPPTTPPVVPPPPAPIPVPAKTPEPVPAPPAAVVAPPAAAPGSGTGTGSGGGNGSGTGTGNGSGQGPGTGSGKGGGEGTGGGSPPEARQMVLPAINGPKQLKGTTVDVTFTVAADGTVVDVKVAPPIANTKYAREFDEAMRGYRFTPAKDPNGKPVPGVIVVTVTF
jgi:protein TonB